VESPSHEEVRTQQAVAGSSTDFTPGHVGSFAPSPTVERRRELLTRLLWITIVVLTIVGVFAAVVRASFVSKTLVTPIAQRPPLSWADQVSIRMGTAAKGLTPGSPEVQQIASYVAGFANRFNSHPVYSLMHLIPGVLILLLAPLQFSRTVRARHIRLHRWSGRTILVLGVGLMISAFYFGLVNPNVPVLEPPTIAFFSAVFVYCAIRAYIAIRGGEVARHREWMIRAYAVLIAIGSVRVVSLPLGVALPTNDLGIVLIASFWVGWLVTIIAAELWIRYSRRTGIAAGAAAAHLRANQL